MADQCCHQLLGLGRTVVECGQSQEGARIREPKSESGCSRAETARWRARGKELWQKSHRRGNSTVHE
jgi:hypothetical protein